MILKQPVTRRKQSQAFLQKSLTKEEVARILSTVTYDRAFWFYNGLGKPSGEHAVSLSDFCNKLKVVSSESLVFHLKRRDFQNWISEVIGDADLASRLNKVQAKNNALRDTLQAFVSNRIKELQDSWPILLTIQ
jgi:alpha-amylase